MSLYTCKQCGWVHPDPKRPRSVAPMPTVRERIEAVAKVFNVTAEEIIGPSRSTRIVEARHLAILLARRNSRFSFSEIGQQFGGRDHTTIMHAMSATRKRIKRNEQFREIVRAFFPELMRKPRTKANEPKAGAA